ERQYNFFNLKNIIILIILFFTFVYIHMAGYSVKSLYIAIFIFIALTLYLLIVERFKERVEVNDEIKEIKNEREREHHVFLDKVKEIEEVEKNQIENIILKNSDDYDIKVWKIGRATSLLIGKRTPRNKVDIDVSEGVYSNLVSRAHGMLNRVNGVWYYEDLGSQNGSGIEKKDDRRKIKLKRNVPVKVESGDIIYLATTKILLK
uniref:FHA domain-containing protein n=1 Tax=uncultured Leptotrichia sp. TaxID=159271 RepID=UPI0026304A2E